MGDTDGMPSRGTTPSPPAAAAAFCAVVLLAGGCTYRKEQWAGSPRFSPDGKLLAYAASQGKMLERKTVAGTVDEVAKSAFTVRWRPADASRAEKSVPIKPRVPRSGHLQVDDKVVLRFSPDSAHLAAVTAKGVTVIDLASGRARRVTRTGEFISSFAWRGNGTVVYAAHTWILGLERNVSTRTFWRLRLGEPVRRRQRIHRERSLRSPLRRTWEYWPDLEEWSPDGRYAVFCSNELGLKKQKYGGRLKLLDADTGRVMPFGRSGFYDGPWVSWKPDGTAAFCLREIHEFCEGELDPLAERVTEALVITPHGQVLDLTGPFNKVFGNIRGAQPWTAEGRYLVISHHHEGYLLLPQPWQVIPAGRRLRPARRIGSGLVPLPIPGLLLGHDENNEPCLADYQGRRLAPVDVPMDLARCAISPDGKRIARATTYQKVVVRNLKHPIAPTQPADKP